MRAQTPHVRKVVSTGRSASRDTRCEAPGAVRCSDAGDSPCPSSDVPSPCVCTGMFQLLSGYTAHAFGQDDQSTMVSELA